MRLCDLAKDIQDVLYDGVSDIIIWKEKRQWKWDYFDNNEDDIKKLENIRKNIDFKAMIVNGYECFACYNLKYIQNRIKNLYYREQ